MPGPQAPRGAEPWGLFGNQGDSHCRPGCPAWQPAPFVRGLGLSILAHARAQVGQVLRNAHVVLGRVARSPPSPSLACRLPTPCLDRLHEMGTARLPGGPLAARKPGPDTPRMAKADGGSHARAPSSPWSGALGAVWQPGGLPLSSWVPGMAASPLCPGSGIVHSRACPRPSRPGPPKRSCRDGAGGTEPTIPIFCLPSPHTMP